MRRADRLLLIIQILRRAGGPIAAAQIAAELEVSLRTLYRDMATLESTGVPIRGEAGVGYVLEGGYDLPPLMFTTPELEAIMLGARMLEGRLDDDLSKAAQDVVAKIAAVIPDTLKESLIDTPLFAPRFGAFSEQFEGGALLRHALRHEMQLSLHYRDLKENISTRIVWPVLLSFFDETVILVTWCTLRHDFRSFRLDQIINFTPLNEKIPTPRKTLFSQWRKKMQAENKFSGGQFKM